MRKNAKKVLCFALVAAMAATGLTSVNSDAAKKAKLKSKSISVNVGKSKTIVIKNKSKKNTYLFKSRNKKIAKVTAKGKVTGVKKGSCKITVREKYKNAGKKKVKKLGVVTVKVNNNKVVPNNNVAPAQSTATVMPANPIQSTPSNGVTPTVAPVQTPEPSFGPTMEPAYGTYEFDGFVIDGKKDVNVDNLVKYGAVCEVNFTAKSDEEAVVNIGYEGLKYSKGFNKDGDVFTGSGTSVTVESGEKSYTAVLDVDKYMSEMNITFESDKKIEILSVNITTQPFDGADYQKMIDNSLISKGNNARLKKVIEKARKGEDVTLAYLGGSITEGCAATDMTVNSDCYAETSYNEFKKKFGANGGDNVHFINAGMSGTPSSLGVIRYQNDVLNEMQYGKYPDVLFIEFVVNDSGECTNGEGMESIIREALEQSSAVFLVFAHTVNFDTGKQEYYKPLGELYNLPMVSVKNAITEFIDSSNVKGCDLSKWFFWHDTLHPDVPGHRLMADMIMNVFDIVDAEEAVEDTNTDIDSINPKYGASFTGMTLLDANVDPDKVDAIVDLEVGSFGDKDTAQNKFQYKKGGKDGVEWFPNCWMHNSGDESFKATVKCNNMMIAYKLANDSKFGTAELYVDGVLKEKMTGYRNDGWNNATVSVVFKENEVKEHTFEIKMAKGSEDKKFTIYAIGYTNADDYKASLGK
mgnify:FL=1